MALLLRILCLTAVFVSPGCSPAATRPGIEPGALAGMGGDRPAGFATTRAATDGERPEELSKLLAATRPSGVTEDPEAAKLRPKAVAEAGRLVGVQTGIAWRYGKLIAETQKHAASMDQAFNFSPLMLIDDDALVLPPILASGDESMRIETGEAATSALKTYEMLQDARFVPAVPNWRAYLQTEGFPAPEEPNPVLLPKNGTEREIWRAAVTEGWDIGVEQADQLYQDNVSKLVRDFRGATLYHALNAGKMVEQPKLAGANLGTQVADRKMNIDQKVYRITKRAAFNADEKAWKPLTAN
jgi:hypothetical protein